ELVLRGHTSAVRRLAFSPDGKRLASGSSLLFGLPELKCWDLDAGPLTRPQRGLPGRLSLCQALHPDAGRFVQFSDPSGDLRKPELSVHDLTSNRTVFHLDPDPGRQFPFAQYHPDGRQIAVFSPKGGIALLDATTGKDQATVVPPPRPQQDTQILPGF